MKLYVYDHCPYCVKARMIFGLKQIEFDLVTLLNDDEKTPIDMIGSKMLPILEGYKDQPMPESLDIIRDIDGDERWGAPLVKASKGDQRLFKWLNEIRTYHYPLAMPRWVKMGLEDFATQGAIDYFTKKKEDYIGSFSEHMDKTPEYISKAHEHLQELEEMIVGDQFFWGECTEDDFHVFAALRCLTTVKGLRFPDKIENYMNTMSELSGVPLHWNKAL